MRGVSKLLSGIQEKIGREINPHVFTKEEFQKRIKDKEQIISNVLSEEIKVITGSIDEYR
jgi:hypothetical protein